MKRRSAGVSMGLPLAALAPPKPAPQAQTPALAQQKAASMKPAPQAAASKPVASTPPSPSPTPAVSIPDMLKQAQAYADTASDMVHARHARWNIPWDNAHDLLKCAAKTGDIEAKVAYDHFLRKGLGGSWPARAWYQSAAADGSGEAMCAFGQMDRFGHGGPKNAASSIAWFVKAGEAGYPQGDYMAGFDYRAKLGDWAGVTDLPRARYRYERAARAGETSAMIHLGETLAEGRGGPKDRAAAKNMV
ncbi:MAG: tetratricopeptide repeat protein [Hyphomonadaceae bacterium]